MDASERDPTDQGPRRSLARRLARLAFASLLALAAGAGLTRGLVLRAERAYPERGRRVEVHGLSQHFLDRGSGPAVVLVHGAYGASQDWAATVLDELATRYRCIAWDRPGHGYSERPAGEVDPGVQARVLLGLVDELGLDRPLLVGFSYGGAVVLAAALERPEALAGVVMLNGPSHPWPDPLDFQYELPGLPVIGLLATETWLMPVGQLLAGSSVERVFDPCAVPEHFAASPVALALRPASCRANAEDVRTLEPFLREQVERYAGLDLPVTMVVSEDDAVVSPTIHSPALDAALPNGEVVRLERAGHQVLYTHPGAVIEAIDGAMARRAGRDAARAAARSGTRGPGGGSGARNP